jgi:flagellar M-ring protein FliF
VKTLNLGALTSRLRSLFSGFTAGQRATTAIALVAALAGAAMFVSWVAKPTYAPLFSGLSTTDASAITAKLTEAKEPYQLADGGQTVLVPQADVYQQRINLSGQGLPAGTGGGDGYSLLDNTSMTSSDFQQKVTYQRALEGELRKTIEAIDGVQTAVVHLAIPADDVFTDSAGTPTASVLVKTAPTVSITASQVEAIVHLVSSSVPKLTADQVTVADSSGHVLSAAGDKGGASALSDQQAQQAQGYEDDTASAVQSMLDKLVGPAHSVTRVDAVLNFDQQTTDKQEYISDTKNPPLTGSTTKETYTGTGTPVGGVLGPDNNAVPGGASAGGDGSSYVKEQQTNQNAVGTLKTTTTTAPGKPSRVSVAVVLDQAVAGSLDNAELTKLITAAAGLDPTRGDVVEVSTMPFDTKAAADAQKEIAAAASDKTRSDLISTGKTGGLILVIVLALLIAVKKGRREDRTPVDIGELTVLREQAALEGSTQAAEPVAIETLPVLPAQPAIAQAEQQAAARREIGVLIDHQPDEVARLLRGWLSDRRT